jgi:hypothetical protein
MGALILKRATASRPSGQWTEDDYDVLEDGTVLGRIFKASDEQSAGVYETRRRAATALRHLAALPCPDGD